MTEAAANPVKLSAVISVHNEQEQLAECLQTLSFADEIVVLLDKCTDRSGAIAGDFTDRVVTGAWAIEGERRNAGIEACRGDWVFEIDADERVSPELAREIRANIENTPYELGTKIPGRQFMFGARSGPAGPWGLLLGKAG